MNPFSSYQSQNPLSYIPYPFLWIFYLLISISTAYAARPVVSDIRITSSPDSGSYYITGEDISVVVTFDQDIELSGNNPTLNVQIGSRLRSATLNNPPTSAASSLTFTYRVVSGDIDTDGISILVNSLRTRGRIRNTGGENANLNHDAIADSADHKVDAVKPQISSIAITSDAGTDNTYITDDEIIFTVTFSENIQVDSGNLPSFQFQLDSNTKTAEYDSTDSSDNTLVFKYTVQLGDKSRTGVAYNSNPVQNKEHLTDEAGNICECIASPLRPHSAHKVKTSKPELSSLRISSIAAHNSGHGPDNDTYYRGEHILFELRFNEDVIVKGEPIINFFIGSQTKEAAYAEEHDEDGDDKTITFAYEINVDDMDTNGISMPADPISFPSSTEDKITGVYGNSVVLTTLSPLSHQSSHRIDGLRVGIQPDTVYINSINITSQGQNGSGQQILIHLTFSESLTVNEMSGTPYINIQVGGQDREAYYSQLTGNNTIVFSYTIRSNDRDTDNITIPGGRIETNGGSISPRSSGKELDMRFSDYNPKGGVTITETRITSDGPYVHGNEFLVNLIFSHPVSVTGRPSMEIKVGGVTRKARYSSAADTANNDTIIPFSYTISTQDRKFDNIYVPQGTINLDGSLIKNSDTFPIDVNLQYPEANVITIDSIAITSQGPYDTNNNKILIDVTFSENIEIINLDDGTPSIPIRVGNRSRTASYSADDDSVDTDSILTFVYQVTTSDSNTNNIVIPVGNINTNGSQIQDAGSSHQYVNLAHTGHKVTGTVQPPSAITIRSINVTSNGPYDPSNNNKILIDAIFSSPVTVIRGVPFLHIQVGGTDRLASYSKNDDLNNIDNKLTFVYYVTNNDSNTNSIVIPHRRIATNGSYIRDTNQLRTVNLIHSSSNTQNRITVNSINIRSNNNDKVLIDVTFSDDVEITGSNNPSINIQIGGNRRTATYSSTDDVDDTDNVLTFVYQFTRRDSNTDNVVIPTGQINLNGSTITDVNQSRTVILDHPDYEPPDDDDEPPDDDDEPPTTNTCDPSDLDPTAFHLENPANNSTKSGIHVISGWACEANTIKAYFDNNKNNKIQLLYGVSRLDTKCRCGDINNGFILLFNYNLLNDGQHTVSLQINNKENALTRQFQVVTLGEEFVKGESASGEMTLNNGTKVYFKWEESRQGFNIIGFNSKNSAPEPLLETPEEEGLLEIPRDGSITSGIHIVSGWICDAKKDITIRLSKWETDEEVGSIKALYRSEREDTRRVCGDSRNGFVAIFNYNILEPGIYVADLFVGDQWQDSSRFQVVRMGRGPRFEFVKNLRGEGTVEMDVSGQIITLRWEEATQALEIINVDDPPL